MGDVIVARVQATDKAAEGVVVIQLILLGINQADMGKRAGVSRQTISLIERGDYSPSVTLALKLAKICQVTVEDIFSYTEEENDE